MVEVPRVVLDGDVISPTGTLLSVVIIDCLNSLAESLRVPSEQDGAVVVFDADDVTALAGTGINRYRFIELTSVGSGTFPISRH